MDLYNFISQNGGSFFVGAFANEDDHGYETQNLRQDNDEDYEPDEVETHLRISEIPAPSTPRTYTDGWYAAAERMEKADINDSFYEALKVEGE